MSLDRRFSQKVICGEGGDKNMEHAAGSLTIGQTYIYGATAMGLPLSAANR